MTNKILSANDNNEQNNPNNVEFACFNFRGLCYEKNYYVNRWWMVSTNIRVWQKYQGSVFEGSRQRLSRCLDFFQSRFAVSISISQLKISKSLGEQRETLISPSGKASRLPIANPMLVSCQSWVTNLTILEVIRIPRPRIYIYPEYLMIYVYYPSNLKRKRGT